MFLPPYLVFIFTLGLSVGSFLNVAGERLPNNRSIRGRSKCPKCNHKLAWYDLIPLVSFVIQRGRCRYCRKKISWQYPAVELATGVAFVLITLYSSHLPEIVQPTAKSLSRYDAILAIIMYFFSLFAVSSLIIIFISDFKYSIIPNKVVIPAIAVALFYWFSTTIYRLYIIRQSILNDISFGKYLLETDFFRDRTFMFVRTFLNTIGGAAVVALVFLVLYWATRGRGMGGGDFKLGFFISLVTGWPNMLTTLFLGFFSGAITSLILMLLKKKRFGDTIPLGPFLCLAAFVVMLYGEELLNWYYRLFV